MDSFQRRHGGDSRNHSSSFYDIIPLYAPGMSLSSWFVILQVPILLLLLLLANHETCQAFQHPSNAFTSYHYHSRQLAGLSHVNVLLFQKSYPFTTSSTSSGGGGGGGRIVHFKKTSPRRRRRQSFTWLQQDPINIVISDRDTNANTSGNDVVIPSKRRDDVAASDDESDHDKLKVWQARMLILLAASLYGTNFTCVKILGENLPLQIGIALRFSVAAMATLPWLISRSVDRPDSMSEEKDKEGMSILLFDRFNIPSKLGPLVGGAEVGLWNSMGFLGQALGLQTSPASTSAFICSLAVVTVPMYDYFLVGKKIPPRSIIGAILAVLGVGLLEVGGDFTFGGGGEAATFVPSTGTLYSLVQPIAFGMGFWRLEYWTRNLSAAGPDAARQLTAAHMLMIATLSMLGSILLFHEPNSSRDFVDFWEQLKQWCTNPTILGAILWTGVVTTAIPSFFETKALKSLSAAETTMLYSTEPIFGSMFAVAVLGESMGMGGVVGAMMVVLGCLYSSLGPGKIEQTT